MVDPDFMIVVAVGYQAITITEIIMVILDLRIVMMVSSQDINVISRMKKECGMVGIMTITIPGVVPTNIIVL